MNSRINRRNILKGGTAALGSLLAVPFLTASGESAETASGNVWNYQKLDPARVADRAYHLYSDGSCMYAAFRAIVESVGEKTAAIDLQASQKFAAFPYQMMKYGKGGVYDYGSLCGMLNGCSAAISLFVTDYKTATAMINELFRFYETEELPRYVPAENKYNKFEKTVSMSVLCHVSSARWCREAESEVSSPRRTERCKRLTADLVIVAVNILNRWYDAQKSGMACVFMGVSDSTKKCTECHAPKGKEKDVSTRMDCTDCHGDIDEKHPETK